MEARINGVFNILAERLFVIALMYVQYSWVFENMHWRGGNGVTFDYRNSNYSGWVTPLGALHNFRNPINNTKAAWQQGANDLRCESPSSYHTGGIQVTLCDGSVRFLTENIDHGIRYKISVRNDNMVVGEF